MDSIAQTTNDIRRSMQSTARNKVTIGTLLSKIQQQLPYCEFDMWVQKEFRIKGSTAHRFIKQSQGNKVRALPNQGIQS